eukprot:gene16432-16610_t
MIADAVYSRVTNETGYFNTHIVYVETVSKGKNSRKRIMRMDQDGENSEALTDSSRLVLTPRYSPDGQKIAYLSYMNNSAHVYLLNLQTKNKETLGNLGEMNFAPRFSPDSKTVVMSLVKGGKSAIYKFDLETKKLVQLTEHRDKEGGEQLYIMDINGGNVRRISFDKGKYSQPVWSPRGDLIAFTKQIGGQFYIGVIGPEGTGERLIAEGYLVEGLGRIANFINGELYGRVTDVPWAVEFPAGGFLPRHPSQLYEAALEGLVLFLILGFVWHRTQLSKTPGRITGLFLIGYAVSRFLVEYVREPDVVYNFLSLPLTTGQLLALPFFVIGIFWALPKRT